MEPGSVVPLLLNGISCYQVEELMEHLPGPDFPTGGQILGTDGYIHPDYPLIFSYLLSSANRRIL